MHSAPAVRHPVRRSRTVLAALGIVAAAGWLLDLELLRQLLARPTAAPLWHCGLLVLAPALSSWLAFSSWRGSAQGELRWDGEQWFFGADSHEAAGRLGVTVDLGAAMLMSFDTPGRRSRWLWLEHRRAPGTWGLLRAAVYSRAEHDAPPQGPVKATLPTP